MEVLVSAVTITFLIVSIYLQLSSCQYEIKYCLGDGNVRLVGGDTNMEGRVEICRNGVWGSVHYCGQTEIDANVICKQLGYSKGGTVLEGAFMTDQPRNYISCSGMEERVSNCNNMTLCETAKFKCCEANVSLEVRCNKKCNDASISSEVALGIVVFLLLTLLVAISTAALIFGVKLKKTQQKHEYESEPHHYVEQQLGLSRIQVSETSGPAYDDPVTFKQKSISDQLEADYINTAKCIAYRKNFAATATNISQPQFQPSSSPTEDEYEVMRQLTYRGDT